jgi:uncharacterized protein YgfB (UPF0149 family)
MTEIHDNALYESVESALSLMDCDIGPAECHGILCGMLCGAQGFSSSTWLNHTTGYTDHLSLDDLGAGHALAQLLEETLSGFESEDFSLRVLLPDENNPVTTRAQALGAWCRGFLAGFGLTEPSDLAELSDDSRGYLRDLHEIGRVEPTLSDDNDDDFSLMELCEYARMGALLLREETQFAMTPTEGNETIH